MSEKCMNSGAACAWMAEHPQNNCEDCCGKCIKRALALLRKVESGELKLFDPVAFIVAFDEDIPTGSCIRRALASGAKAGGVER